MRRYYDLDSSGNIKGSFANPQVGMTLNLLEECPFQLGKWDGTKWVEIILPPAETPKEKYKKLKTDQEKIAFIAQTLGLE